MEKLVKSTAAYKIFLNDLCGGRLSHAYMLYFSDAYNLRPALKLFAKAFFGAEEGGREANLIESESLTDLRIYPLKDAKLTADAAAQIVADAAIKPVGHDKKLYVISSFEGASAIVQNKLLKVLEEPPQGVHFLLGATSLSPVLDTVKSRVKLLEIPPFSEGEIYSALNRMGAHPLNARAAAACGGVLGVARNMTEGGWYGEVRLAAEEICSASTVKEAVRAAAKYGDFKYRQELLCEMQRLYFAQLKRYAERPDYEYKLKKGAVLYAVNAVNGALADVKFNANFSSLLYNLLLSVATENGKW